MKKRFSFEMMKFLSFKGMRSLIAVLKSIINVEKAAYISNHDDAEPMFVNEEEKRPTIGGLIVSMCGKCLFVL